MTDNFEVLDSFLIKARNVARMGSKELRIPANEAFELTTIIASLLSKNVSLNNRIDAMTKVMSDSIVIDGGNFS
jgi:hypothetical protein